MNILLDKLPTAVKVGGKMYDINADFRTGIRLEMTAVSELDDTEKLMRRLLLYYGDIACVPADVGAAFTAVMNFYHCDKDNASQGGTATNRRTQIYSFEHDAPYIYAAFLQQYGIDLNKIESEDLHWWKFSALFQSLGEDMKISKIMYYRDVDLRGKSKGERAFLSDMKKRYALKCSRNIHTQFSSLAQRDAKMKAYVERRFAAIETR